MAGYMSISGVDEFDLGVEGALYNAFIWKQSVYWSNYRRAAPCDTYTRGGTLIRLCGPCRTFLLQLRQQLVPLRLLLSRHQAALRCALQHLRATERV